MRSLLIAANEVTNADHPQILARLRNYTLIFFELHLHPVICQEEHGRQKLNPSEGGTQRTTSPHLNSLLELIFRSVGV
jgi:hypothetical protein